MKFMFVEMWTIFQKKDGEVNDVEDQYDTLEVC